MNDIIVTFGEESPINVDTTIEVISVALTTSEIINTTFNEESPMSLSFEESSPIEVSFTSQSVFWDDIIGRPIFDDAYKCYIFNE